MILIICTHCGPSWNWSSRPHKREAIQQLSPKCWTSLHTLGTSYCWTLCTVL